MIKINDRFYINADTNCYMLQEKTIVQDEKSKNFGQEQFKVLGYYTTIESCLEGVLKVTTREFISKEELTSLKDLKEFIKNENKYLRDLELGI
jgi:hypothetical protein